MVDVSVEAPALARGGDVHGQVRIRPAGAGANAAVWGAAAGARTRLYGCRGDDVAGRILPEALAARGVEACLSVAPGTPTGAMLVVREAGERSMVADRGANAHFEADHLPERLEAGAVLISGYLFFHPGSEGAARAAVDRAASPLVAVDAASWPLLAGYGPARFLEATAGATVLMGNAEELSVLTRAAPDLSGPYQAVVTKEGPDGATMTWAGTSLRARAVRPVDPVDVTGAGDAFDGVLLAHLARGADPQEALDLACDAGRRCALSPEPWPDP